MEEGLSFSSLLIVATAAFIVPIVLARLPAVPIVVGEILVGIAIGRSGFDLVQHGDISLEILSEIGFAFLMFLSGLEIDFSLLNRGRTPSANGKGKPSLLSTAVLSFVATLMIAVPVGFTLAYFGLVEDPWMIAFILSATSLGVVVPVLKQSGLNASNFGQSVLLGALLADFVTMLMITVYATLYSSGLTLEILLIGILFIAFLVTYRLGLSQIRRPVVRRLIERLEFATSQIKVRGSLALMLAFVALAQLVEVELILGAFLAGAVISLLSSRHDAGLHEKLDAIGYGFFIPIFFVMVGVEFNFPLLLENPQALLLAPLLFVIAIAVKVGGALVFRRLYDWRTTLSAGLMLSTHLSITIAAAAIGVRMGAISEETNAAVILMAALTATVCPLLANTLLPEQKKKEHEPFLIYSAANLGLQVGQELRKHGEKVVFIEPEKRLVDLVRKEGFEVQQSEGSSGNLENAGLPDVHTLLVLSGDDDRNFAVAQAAVNLGAENILVVVHEPTRLSDFRELGVRATTPTMLRPMMLASMARNPDIFELLTSTSDERDIREFAMRNPVFAKRPISELVLPGDSLILTIYRNGEVRVPHGSTRLNLGDRLTVLGETDSLQAVQRLLEG